MNDILNKILTFVGGVMAQCFAICRLGLLAALSLFLVLADRSASAGAAGIHGTLERLIAPVAKAGTGVVTQARFGGIKRSGSKGGGFRHHGAYGGGLRHKKMGGKGFGRMGVGRNARLLRGNIRCNYRTTHGGGFDRPSSQGVFWKVRDCGQAFRP